MSEYEGLWESISQKCLKGSEVPFALKALWLEKLHGNDFLEKWMFGCATLIKDYPKDIYDGYTEEFIGSKKDGDAWAKMFGEIGFIALEDDGGLIGLWFYKAGIMAETSPVIWLDSEGQLSILSPDIINYPIYKAWIISKDDDYQKVYKLVKEWSEKYNLGDLVETGSLDQGVLGFPDPDKRFEYYYNNA